MSNAGSWGSDRNETSSTIPSVNPWGGRGVASASSAAFAMDGVNSFDDRPYRPPTTTAPVATCATPSARARASAATTSRNRGSPTAPGSFVRSSTATEVTDDGNASIRRSTENGR